jgi:hypothetical protein
MQELGFFELNQNLLELAQESNATYFLPGYTYSARRSSSFDANKVVPDPQVGALSRVAFQNKIFRGRTIDPDFSYLLLGEKHQLDEKHFQRSFGDGSFHSDILNTSDPEICLIGPVLDTGLTPILHLEAQHAVPWRKFISTRHLCQNEKCNSKHQYFAKIPQVDPSRLPRRALLKTPILALPSTTFQSDERTEVVIFAWNEFQHWFRQEIQRDVYFQSANVT